MCSLSGNDCLSKGIRAYLRNRIDRVYASENCADVCPVP